MKRVLVGGVVAALCAAVGPVIAAAPASGGLPATWTGESPTGLSVPNGVGCLGPTDPSCDRFVLSIAPDDPAAFVVEITPSDPDDDWDLFVHYPDGTLAAASADSAGDEEVVVAHREDGEYTVSVLPFDVGPSASYAGSARESGAPVDSDMVACLEPVPAAVGSPLRPDETVSLDVLVMLDGVDETTAAAVFDDVARAYEPLGIDVNVTSERVESFTGNDAAAIIEQATAEVGGARPPGVDVVYIMTTKDLASDGDTSLAGLADCIGGVRFRTNGFAVGEADPGAAIPFGPLTIMTKLGAKVAAHEIAHLLGAHHHYANCAEGVAAGEPRDVSPCTLMFNDLTLLDLVFGTLERAVVRGHAEAYAS